MRILVVTGLSGSGKSTAIRTFEDMGLFCVDNLPVVMIENLVQALQRVQPDKDTVVLGIDARETDFLDDWERTSDTLRAVGHQTEIVYLEARDDVLVRRFSETRRRHPLMSADILAALARERQILRHFRQNANYLIDSSVLNVHDLRRQVARIVSQPGGSSMLVTLLSFGYKYGVPLESDVMFDLRCLPNPFFVPELKHKTGLDDDVLEYVMSQPSAREILDLIQRYLSTTLPLYEQEMKASLTVGLGCTGGKHRSISFVRAVERHLSDHHPDFPIFIRHRDLDK